MSRLVRVLLILMLTISSFGTLVTAAQEWSEDYPAPLDLAAMVLTPGDLAEAGLDGYGLNRFGYPFNGAFLARHAEFRSGHAPGSLSQALLASGLQREYLVNYGYSPDGEQAPYPYPVFPQEVEIQISEFASESGAEDGFEILTPMIFGGDSSGEVVESETSFGDEQLIGRIHISNVNDDYRALALTVRTGNLISRISLIDNAGGEPDLPVLEALGELLEDRIEAGLDGDLPGGALAQQMPRFHQTVDLSTFGWIDGYLRVGGETFPRVRAIPNWGVPIEADYGDAIDVYVQQRSFRVEPGPGENGSQPSGTGVLSHLLRFDDAETAGEWMEDAAASFMASSGLKDLVEDAEATAYGDDTRTFTYLTLDSNRERDGRRIYSLVGATVIVLDISRLYDPLTPALVDAVTTAHVTCLVDGGCSGQLPLPPQATHAETACPDGSADASAEAGTVGWCIEAGAAFSEPLLHDGVLYTWNSDAFLYALDAGTGELLWRTTPGPLAQSEGLPPMVIDDVIVVVLRDPAAIIGFDLETGEQRWLATALLESIIGTYTDAWVEDDLVVVTSSTQDLLRIDPEFGDVVDQIVLETNLTGAVSVHDHGDGLVFAVQDRDIGRVLAVDSTTGELVWSNKLPGELESIVVEDDGIVYVMSDSTIMLLDAESGETLDEFSVDAAPKVPARLDVTDESLLLHYYGAQGEPVLISIDRATGEVNWQLQGISRNRAGLAVGGDILYLPGSFGDVSRNLLFAIDIDSGEVKWEAEIGSGESATPVPGDGVIYVAEDEGTFFAIHAPDLAGAARENDEDEPVEDDNGADLATYESELYGYSLQFDPDEWEMLEDESPDDQYDSVVFAHDLGFVAVIGDPDYDDGDLEDCVADYRAGLEDATGVDDVRELRTEGGDDGDRTWSVFVYSYDDGTSEDAVDSIRSISCQALGDGVTLVVLQDAPEETYDELTEAREELLAGFEER